MSARASRHPLSSLAAGLLALVLAVAGIATAPLAAYADETVDATTTEVAQPAAADEEPAAEPADEAAPADAAPVGAPEPEPAVQQGEQDEQAPAAALRAPAPEFGITATPSTGVQAGDTITVSGTLPATIATRAGGEITTQVYLWLCAQPEDSTVGTAGGRASNSGGRTDCAGSPVSIAPVAVPSAGIMTGTGTVTDGVWTFEVPFTIAADAIGADACTTLTEDGRDCAVFTRLNHNFHAGSVADPYQLDQYATLAFLPAFGIEADPADGVRAGDTVTVRGTMPATIANRSGGEITTQVYLWLCAQPDGSTVGTAGGRASNSGGRTDCAGSPVSIAPVAVPSAGIMTGTGTVTDGVWTFEVPFTIAADAIGADACTTLTEDGRDCAVFTRLNHNFHAGSVADPYQLDQYAVLTFAPATGISVTPATGVQAGDTVTVRGTMPATIATRAGGELTTQVYLWLCAQPEDSTVGTAGGRASNSGGRTDCAGSPVSIAPVAVPSAGIMTGTGTVTDGVWTFEVPFTIAADAIGDDACTTASAAGRDCAIFTRLNHNFHAGSVADPYQLDQYAVLTFGAAASEPVATAVGLSLSKTTGIVPGDRITATATVSPAGAAGTVEILLDGAVIGSGPAGTPLAVASGALAAGAHAFSARFVPADATAFAASSSPELVVEAVSPVPGAGSFTWGGYSEFHQYITGPIARGSITASSGAARSAGGFTWPQTQGGSYDPATGLGTVHYRGALRFTGHNGALDITFANPVIRIDSAASATLLATTNGSQVAFASLDLAAAIRSVEADGSVRYTSVPVRLLAGGAAFYDGRYPVGTLLNPASFVIGSASTAADAPARVVAAAAVENRREPAATPPATEGIEVEGELTEGGEITATASGFQPDEEDILVVIYSEPTVLSRTLQADANGVATWTGRLPAGLTGEHTLTFQGSVNRGAVLDIAALEIGTCTIQDAAFEWGFKESFRAYLDSSIAHGSWTVSDGAEYETPLFRFANGTGSYDAAAQTGRIAFPGAIRFTAHEGVLDTVFSNPTFTFIDAGTAVLALDVDGDTREGDHVTAEGVEFLELDLSAATTAVDGGVVTISGIATTLTEAGNESFGTYPAGEEFDPITITITTADDCAAAIAEPEPTAGAPVDGEEASDASGADLTWMWWLIGAVVLLAAIIAIIVAVRRKKTA